MRAGLCICMLVSGLLPAQAQATTGFEPVKDFAPNLISYDVQGGYVEAWSRYVPCGANTATFTTTILQSHTDPKWNSQIRVSLNNNPTITRKMENYDPDRFDAAIAITLVSDTNGLPQTKSFAVIERQENKKGMVAFKLFPEKIRNNNAYFVRLRWDNSGRVVASINNGPERAMSMGKTVTTIGLYFSGVKAQVRDLQIGRIGPRLTEKEACGIS